MANYNGSLEAVDCHIHSVRYDMVLESIAGDRLGCLIRSPTMLWRRRYDQPMLEPWKRCFYTIMANHHGSLEAVDRHIHSLRYDMVLHYCWAYSSLEHHIVSHAVNVAINSCLWLIIIGYDSIEGYMPLLKLWRCVSAVLQPRRWPDEVQFGMTASNTIAPYRIWRCEWIHEPILVAQCSCLQFLWWYIPLHNFSVCRVRTSSDWVGRPE